MSPIVLKPLRRQRSNCGNAVSSAGVPLAACKVTCFGPQGGRAGRRSMQMHPPSSPQPFVATSMGHCTTTYVCTFIMVGGQQPPLHAFPTRSPAAGLPLVRIPFGPRSAGSVAGSVAPWKRRSFQFSTSASRAPQKTPMARGTLRTSQTATNECAVACRTAIMAGAAGRPCRCWWGTTAPCTNQVTQVARLELSLMEKEREKYGGRCPLDQVVVRPQQPCTVQHYWATSIASSLDHPPVLSPRRRILKPSCLCAATPWTCLPRVFSHSFDPPSCTLVSLLQPPS